MLVILLDKLERNSFNLINSLSFANLLISMSAQKSQKFVQLSHPPWPCSDSKANAHALYSAFSKPFVAKILWSHTWVKTLGKQRPCLSINLPKPFLIDGV